MKVKDWLLILIIIGVYFLNLFTFKQNIFSYRFDKRLIDRYYLSQDISHEVAGKRLFLSDEEIYLATGYLYVKGENPANYNFDHPPLIKYFFGFSIILFGNPYIIQILFGIILLFLTFYLGKKLFNSSKIAIISCFFLAVDPLFIDSSSLAQLDLGEAVFCILYFISSLYLGNNFVLSGIALGLFSSSKSLSTPLFFLIFITIFKLYKKQFILRNFLYHILIAGLVYSLVYTKSFLDAGGKFNIIFFALKTIKYRVVHNITSFPGASLFLFLTGYFQTWWGVRGFLKANVWSPIWTFGFFVILAKLKEIIKKGKIDSTNLFPIFVLLYFTYLGIQAPFTRYFLIILPFFYLTLSEFIVTKLIKASEI